jgi:hypothetical protein
MALRLTPAQVARDAGLKVGVEALVRPGADALGHSSEPNWLKVAARLAGRSTACLVLRLPAPPPAG